jgi:hypothetical protein
VFSTRETSVSSRINIDVKSALTIRHRLKACVSRVNPGKSKPGRLAY